jgi:hypothetical protein
MGHRNSTSFLLEQHGQPGITEFDTGGGFTFDCLDILCSALLTFQLLSVLFGQIR